MIKVGLNKLEIKKIIRVYNLFLTEEGMSIFRNHAQFEYQCYKRGFEGLKAFTYEELEIYLAIQRKINESFQRDVEEVMIILKQRK